MKHCSTVLSTGEGNIYCRAVIDMLFNCPDRITFEVFKVITVLFDGLIPAGIRWGAGNDRNKFSDFHRPVFYHPGTESVFIFHNYRTFRCRCFQRDPFSPDPTLFFSGICLNIEINHPSIYQGQDIGECFGCEIKPEFPCHRIKGKPAESFAVYNNQIGPVDTPCFVEKDNFWNGNRAKAFGHEFFDKSNVSRKCGADIVGLEELDLFPYPATCTALCNQRDVAVFAPVENLFYRWFA